MAFNRNDNLAGLAGLPDFGLCRMNYALFGQVRWSKSNSAVILERRNFARKSPLNSPEDVRRVYNRGNKHGRTLYDEIVFPDLRFGEDYQRPVSTTSKRHPLDSQSR